VVSLSSYSFNLGLLACAALNMFHVIETFRQIISGTHFYVLEKGMNGSLTRSAFALS
jgi:hypothetical protein